jgi:DNA-binding response OmpR family regulator
MLLEKDGYEVSRASSNEESIEAVRVNRPDAIILETTPLGEDGLEACRRLRCMTDAVILLVGPGARAEAAVRGLQLGADDYLGKPYSYEVLASRLKACLNQRGRQNGTGLTHMREAGLVMDASHRRVFVRDGRCVSLTRREFNLLRFLVDNHDRVISADDILARVWGPEYVGDRDLVKQFIYRLRCKLEADPDRPRSIVTVRGSGYAFEPSTQPSLKRLLAASGGHPPARLPALRSRYGALAIPPPGEVTPSTVLRVLSSDDKRHRPGVERMVHAAQLGAVALICLLGVLSAGWIVEASGAAIPGDHLYPVKIGLEGLRYGLASDESEHPAIHLQYARERMEEVSALVEEGRLEGLSRTLAAFEREMLAASWAVAHPGLAGADEASALRAQMEAEARSHDEALSALLSVAPEEARPSLEHALIVLNTGRGTSQALFIGPEPAAFPEPTTADRPAEDASLVREGRAPEETRAAHAPADGGMPRVNTPVPTQVPYSSWVTGYEAPGATSGSGAEAAGEGPAPQVPVLTPVPGGFEAPPTSSPTPTPRTPRPTAR